MFCYSGSSCFCVGDLSGSCRSVRGAGRSADIRADPRYSRFVQEFTEQPYRRFARMRADDQQMHGWDVRVRRLVAPPLAIGGPSRGSAGQPFRSGVYRTALPPICANARG